MNYIDRLTDYRSRYGYPADIALIAEFWWRVEHLGTRHPWRRWSPSRRMFRSLRSIGYEQRKRWEQIGFAQKERRETYERVGQKPVM